MKPWLALVVPLASLACVLSLGCGTSVIRLAGCPSDSSTCTNDAAGPDASAPPDGASDARAGESSADSGNDVEESGSDDSGPTDSAAPPDAESEAEAASDSGSSACLSWPLGGIGVPAGTVATAATSYSTYVPSLAIDGDLSTFWNASDYTDWLSLQFPSPIAITGIRIAANSSPPTNETYSITALGSTTVIGSASEMIYGHTSIDGGPPYTIEPAIPVTPGTYAGITINVGMSSSWITANEVSLLTSACP